MPSSGYPMECFDYFEDEKTIQNNKTIEANARHAMASGMFIEWLSCFVGAYNYMRNKQSAGSATHTAGAAANIASQAGIIEWDL